MTFVGSCVSTVFDNENEGVHTCSKFLVSVAVDHWIPSRLCGLGLRCLSEDVTFFSAFSCVVDGCL